jgi:hypothetical protein
MVLCCLIILPPDVLEVILKDLRRKAYVILRRLSLHNTRSITASFPLDLLVYSAAFCAVKQAQICKLVEMQLGRVRRVHIAFVPSKSLQLANWR